MVTFMETQRIKLTPPSLEYSESMFTVIEDSKEEFAPFLPWVTDSLTLTDIEENTTRHQSQEHQMKLSLSS